ncbi:MAG: ABC transporter ATP-binding protein, partial [Gammaproteobacteria bacterium]|nr:ABC transporter ATP-binding protein [Gammaproteobacteria bacterium]
FSGAILLISHDRHLLANTVDEFLIIDKGRLSRFNGDLEDYRTLILKGSVNNESLKDKKNSRSKLQKKEVKSIKTNIISLEKTLKRLQRKLSEVNDKLNSPDSYNEDSGNNLHDLLREQVNLISEIENAEQEWLELNQKLDESI